MNKQCLYVKFDADEYLRITESDDKKFCRNKKKRVHESTDESGTDPSLQDKEENYIPKHKRLHSPSDRSDTHQDQEDDSNIAYRPDPDEIFETEHVDQTITPGCLLNTPMVELNTCIGELKLVVIESPLPIASVQRTPPQPKLWILGVAKAVVYHPQSPNSTLFNSDWMFVLGEEPHLGWLDIQGVPKEDTSKDENQVDEYDSIPFCASTSSFDSPNSHAQLRLFAEAQRIIGKFHQKRKGAYTPPKGFMTAVNFTIKKPYNLDHQIMHCLTHFRIDEYKGKSLLCILQASGRIITQVELIHSNSAIGDDNPGEDSLKIFLENHSCPPPCEFLGLHKLDVPYTD
ncbi:uncharacterized protein MELLADRAFT_104163 [Melampsora larici-populina 98AG31]|uniref:Alpha-type protein kinase domain-containing protein n=1 Tax=Melampsora larici-populina (strain 98AG31 / pathotype 3-4-7) TaxID=747676 RepID=F4RDS8_MELLP|nr:uncharacterized protein MELLADRAFT_104163 [Melampsora larici-populina 98AG31]EGG09556.1 hypothetical protein MELLADRAFT_104163 [Melampsora larici-populina 98AG31]